MVFVIYYTLLFINDFNIFFNNSESNLETCLLAKGLKNNSNFLCGIKILIGCTFVAFISNFYKSLFTIHSLEFGKFGNVLTLREIFKSQKCKVFGEILLRSIIVVLFISLEKKLTEHEFLNFLINKLVIVPTNNKSAELFVGIGIIAILLYLFMIIWLVYINKFAQNINKSWKNTTFWQFGFGAGVGITLLELGKSFNNSNADYLILGIGGVSIVCSIGVIVTIIINEFQKVKI